MPNNKHFYASSTREECTKMKEDEDKRRKRDAQWSMERGRFWQRWIMKDKSKVEWYEKMWGGLQVAE